jgi:hypothetical protein
MSRDVVGGFDGSVRAGMSPGTLRLVAQLEAAEAARDRDVAAQRMVRAEQWQESALAGAIAMAIERGEDMSNPRRLRGEGLGHTPAEFIALASAEQDRQDAWEAARVGREFERWQLRESASHQVDTSAPTPDEVDARELLTSRTADAVARRRERSKTIQAARRLAAMDRERRR